MSLNVSVRVQGTLLNKKGEIAQKIDTHNLITYEGYDALLSIFKDSPTQQFNYVAIGRGSITPQVSDYALRDEVTRVKGNFKQVKKSTSLGTLVAVFPKGVGTGDIQEAGILNSNFSGTLFDRVTFPVIKKGAEDSLELRFTLNFEEMGN